MIAVLFALFALALLLIPVRTARARLNTVVHSGLTGRRRWDRVRQWRQRWQGRLRVPRQREPPVDPLALSAGWDLLAAGMRAGLPVPVAVRATAAELPSASRKCGTFEPGASQFDLSQPGTAEKPAEFGEPSGSRKPSSSTTNSAGRSGTAPRSGSGHGPRGDSGSPGKALAEVAELLALGADPVSAWHPALRHPDTAELARAARRTAQTGSGLAEVAADLATQARTSVRERAEARAQRAAVWVSGPLGLCFLPAFFCLGVLPVVAAMVQRLVSSW